MENKEFPNFDFDPEFSEYNPVLNCLKQDAFKKQEGFFTNFIKKFNYTLLIQLD